MRRVVLSGTNIESSCIGMGCASLGSRISGNAGMQALAQAFDHGVTWFDVAPSYGAGEAERILGNFLRGRRSQATVCTKVGLDPPKLNPLIKLAHTLGRPFTRHLQVLRKEFRRLPSTRNVNVPLTPALIETSVERSLKRLDLDYVDILALHDPAPADVIRDDVCGALTKILEKGQARYIAVAGSLDASLAAISTNGPYRIIQLADDPTVEPLSSVRKFSSASFGIITHSVLGIGGSRDYVIEQLRSKPELMQALAAAGYSGKVSEVATKLLFARAFASNPDGVVLASMFSAKHLNENLEQAACPIDVSAPALVQQCLAGPVPTAAA